MALTAAAVGGWMAANAGTIAAVSAAASVAATAMTTVQQKQTADAQFKQQEEANKQQAIAAASSYDDLSATEIDLNRQAADAAVDQQRQAAQARGRVNLFASAAGTMGGSVDSLLFDIDSTRDQNINTILDQRQAGLYQVRQQAEGIRQGAVANNSRQAVNQPSWLAAGLEIGTKAMQGFGSYQANKSTYEGTKPMQAKGST